MNIMRMWFDIESQEIITESDLQYEYDMTFTDGEHDGITFEDFVENCQTRANGSLMEIKNAYLFQHV